MTTMSNGTPVEACAQSGHHGEHEWMDGPLRRFCPGDPSPAPDEQPAQCEETSGGGRCRLPAGHHLHRAGGWTWAVVEPVPGRLDPAAADEPTPVPPPVDALLCFEHDFSVVAEHAEGDVTVCLGCGERGDEAEPAWLDRVASAAAVYGHPATSEGAYDDLVAEVRALWAAGVEEGRRQQAAEVERLQVLLDHAEQYARDLQDGGRVGG